jgi:hypothetical protein
MLDSAMDVKEIPLTDMTHETIISIESRGLGDYTHGYFKYPCKFIPHVPRWAIKKYGQGRSAAVLDPFCGSGTTLVEAILHGNPAFGIDFDPFSRLLSKVKSTPLSETQLQTLKDNVPDILEDSEQDVGVTPSLSFPNSDFWFDERDMAVLSRVKNAILRFGKRTRDQDIEDFLLICLASIVRRTSRADNQSPKPYVSKRIKKTPAPVIPSFKNVLARHTEKMEQFSLDAKGGRGRIIGSDARTIDARRIEKYNGKGPSLAITSPPYINAFDVVRTFKMENYILGLIHKEDVYSLKRKQIGTESIPASEYSELPEPTGNSSLDSVTLKIYPKDRRRAHIVHRFFSDMRRNLQAVHDVLNDEGVYCLVVGDSTIREVPVPTHEILGDIGEDVGFKLIGLFSYRIKNHYLRFPRQGRGGLIKRDWVISFEK